MKNIPSLISGLLFVVLVLSCTSLLAQVAITNNPGTVMPKSLLQVHDINLTGQVFQLTNATSGYDAAAKGFSISFENGFSTVIRNQYNDALAGFSFLTNDGSEKIRLTIRNNGRIGIGTSDPQFLLHITSSTNATPLVIQGSATQTNSYPLLILRKSDGSQLLNLNSDHYSNVFLGINSGLANTPSGLYNGQNNIFIGYQAGSLNVSGYSHTFTGTQSGNNNTTGNYNTGYGVQSLYTNSTGSFNVAMGNSALASVTGNSNTGIGYAAGTSVTTGIENVLIGMNANVTDGTFSNAIVVGKGASATAANQVRLGNSSITSLFCQGAYGSTTTSSPNLYVSSSGQIQRSTASTPSGTGISGQVAYWSGTSGLTSNANLIWDNTNSRLGIGTTVPGQKLSVEGTLGLLEAGITPQYHTIFQAGDQSGDLSLTFPVSAGTNGQFLSTDGSGTLSWISGESPLSFSNGLTRSSNTVKFGGNLTENTSVTQDAAETLTFTNSGTANTMINLASTGDFQIQDNGTAFFTANDLGNIGIGTTAPSQKLSVGGTVGILEGGATPVHYTIFQGGDQSSSVTYTLPVSDGSSSQVLSTNGSGILSWASASPPLSFTNGLTVNPNTVKWGGDLLENTVVTQNNAESLTFSNGATANTIVNLASTGDFQIQDNGTAFFTATDGGRIGIGTANPNEQLELTGNIRMPATTASAGIIYSGLSTFAHTYGTSNTFIGKQSGNLSLTGSSNVGFGFNALNSLTSGISNAAIGHNSLNHTTNGSFNVAIGYSSMANNTTGGDNIAIGSSALSGNIGGSYNVAIGNNALAGITSGTGNTAIGTNAGVGLSDEINNTAVGYTSSIMSGSSNSVVLGATNILTGSNSVVLGTGSSLIGSNSILIGNGVTVNTDNTVKLGNGTTDQLFCSGAYAATTSFTPNLYVSSAGQIMRSTGTFGTVSGSGIATRIAYWSGSGTSTTLTSSTNLYWDATNSRLGIGTSSPTQGLDVNGNIRFASDGYIYAGTDRFIHSLGTANTFLGRISGNPASTGDYNTGLGYSALTSHTTGTFNTGVGTYALRANTAGSYNTAVGTYSLDANTSGTYNTATGYGALNDNSGDFNTADGAEALAGNTTGLRNTAVGRSALGANTIGNYNTSVGCNSYSIFADGTYNTSIGYNAGPTAVTAKLNTTSIGYNAVPTSDNMVRIGNGNVQWIGGAVNWSVLSDGRFKRDIKEDIPGLAFIMQLRPVSYKWDIQGLNSFMQVKNSDDNKGRNADEEGIRAQENILYTGFISQEVEKAAQSIRYNFSGVTAPKNANDIYSLRYAEFVVPLVKAVQEQQGTIQSLTTEIETLKKDREMLLERLNRLEEKVNK